ncbi:hypothetical protein HMPREF9714_00957 [Myroides odoratimimus CCUG 12901]|nr:hypothetical protein HMPREF9714_00957 [Myroides odoratimimus CCUG 12901]
MKRIYSLFYLLITLKNYYTMEKNAHYLVYSKLVNVELNY